MEWTRSRPEGQQGHDERTTHLADSVCQASHGSELSVKYDAVEVDWVWYLWFASPAMEAMMTTLGLSDFRNKGTIALVMKYTPMMSLYGEVGATHH